MCVPARAPKPKHTHGGELPASWFIPVMVEGAWCQGKAKMDPQSLSCDMVGQVLRNGCCLPSTLRMQAVMSSLKVPLASRPHSSRVCHREHTRIKIFNDAWKRGSDCREWILVRPNNHLPFSKCVCASSDNIHTMSGNLYLHAEIQLHFVTRLVYICVLIFTWTVIIMTCYFDQEKVKTLF